MTTLTNQSIKLPKAISETWKISRCLFIKKKCEIYQLEGITKKETSILKIYRHGCFSKKRYKKISHITGTHLLLPKEHYINSGIHYVIYPQFTPLKKILCQNGLSLYELLTLAIDLTHAVQTLQKHHFLEADISPNNIYQKEEKNFCLGDINLHTTYTIGTPGYIAPELLSVKSKSPSKEIFDKAMQYSICKLLDSIYQLNKSIQKDSISKLISTGTQKQPENRFTSLTEMREELEKQQKEIETDDQYQLFQIKDTNHILFRAKTLPLTSKKRDLLYPIVWGTLVLAGCIILILFYQHLHPQNSVSQSNGILLSQISDVDNTNNTSLSSETTTLLPDNTPITISSSTSSPSCTEDTISTATPAKIPATTTKIQKKEINIQNKKLTSLSKILSQTNNPEEVICIYAGENQLTDISSINQFSNIKELYLDNNYIQKLSDISSLENLEILVLSYNKLTYLSDISGLRFLKHLDISANPDFKDISSLEHLTNLDILNIAGTGISKNKYQILCNKLKGCQIIY